MSCYDELAIMLYTDGELEEAQRRAVESHLMTCRSCRERVVQLGDEAELFSEVLQERRRVPRAVREPAPARGFALGIGPTLLAVAAVTTALGWLFDTAAPATSRWLGPLSPRGAYDMAFDLIFLLRDEAPSALAFATAVAAMASASALLTFLLSALLRRIPSGGAIGLALLLALTALPGDARAHFGLHSHDEFELAAGETHDGTLFVSADDVDIDGTVEGDLVVFAHNLTVRGEVRGNVLAVSRNYEQPGNVRGSVHVAAIRTHVSGRLDGNLYAFTEDLTLAPGARIGRDAAIAAERSVLEGEIGRDLYAACDDLELRGAVARNMRSRSQRLALYDSARVDGNLTAALPEGREIELSSGARVAGETVTAPLEGIHARRFGGWTEAGHWAAIVLHVAAGFAVAMLLHAFLPAVFGSRVATAPDFFRALGTGFVVIVAAPVGLLLLALTVVGLPLAAIGASLYLIGLYVGLLLVASLIGSALVDPGETRTSFGLALLAGLATLVILLHLPVVGVPFRIVATVVGAGLLAARVRSAWAARGLAPA